MKSVLLLLAFVIMFLQANDIRTLQQRLDLVDYRLGRVEMIQAEHGQ